MKPAEEFYSWYVVNCVFNVFLSYQYRHHVEHCNNSRHQKNFVVVKAFKNTAS